MSDLENRELDSVNEEEGAPGAEDTENTVVPADEVPENEPVGEPVQPAEETHEEQPAGDGPAPVEEEPAPAEEESSPVGEEPASAEKEPSPEEPAVSEEKTETDGVNGIGIAMSLCDAIIYAVGRDRFHGGVRPDNISVRDSQVFLGGTLKHGVGEFTPQELEYMAPELFWDGIRSPAADVYSVGLVLYSLYNFGRLPFWPATGAITPNARASGLQRRMSDEPLIPPERADAELAAVILRALAFRPEERWHDVTELRDALGSCDASNSPIDISLAMSGLLTRNADARPPESSVSTKNTHTYFDDVDISGNRRPQRRKNLSWLWVLLGVLFLAGALVLLLNDQFSIGGPAPTATPEPTAVPTPTASPEPTTEPTPTAEPTKRPSGPKYVVYREDVSWDQAVARCEELGGWLAMPMSEAELNDIARYCNNEELPFVWLGASRQEDGRWMTPDGEVPTYYPWSVGEPSMIDASDGVAENYLLLWRIDEDTWLFNDSRGDPVADYPWIYSGQIGFVCQMWE